MRTAPSGPPPPPPPAPQRWARRRRPSILWFEQAVPHELREWASAGGLPQRTREWWTMWQSSPQAEHFSTTDWDLGARQPGEHGPFGEYGANEDDGPRLFPIKHPECLLAVE
ncbi:phage terminase small subunit [Streptomyces murinus]